MNVMGLVQLTQATAGVRGGAGEYFYTLGLQRYAAKRQLNNAEDLETLLRGVLLAAIGPADGVASGVAFRAARTGDLKDIEETCRTMSSDRLPPEMRWASVHMGRRLWQQSRAWPWAAAVHDQLDGLIPEEAAHHAVVFGALVSETTSSEVRAIAVYLFNMVRALVETAVKVVPLPELVGQRALEAVQPTISVMAGQLASRGPGEIVAVPIR